MKNCAKKSWKISFYTIVEMMMVVAVFMIILSMAMAAWLNGGDQAKLRNAASAFNSQLNLARSIAVAERELVKVVFDQFNNSVRCRIYYDNTPGNNSDDQLMQNQEPLVLPAGVFFMNTSTPSAGNSVSLTLPSSIVFDRVGSCYSGDVNMCMIGSPSNGSSVQTGQNYYAININRFTGRITTVMREVD